MHRNLFYKAFPPPKFLKMSAVGFDISDGTIHFVELKESKGGFVVVNFGEKEIAPGVIEKGEIKNASKLTEVLSSLKNKFDVPFVSISLPEQHAYLFKLRIPDMKRNQIRG
ncbi:hypothetical protein MNBD_BACTEROID05-1008, partial [hydrothermal vent metagenome]